MNRFIWSNDLLLIKTSCCSKGFDFSRLISFKELHQETDIFLTHFFLCLLFFYSIMKHETADITKIYFFLNLFTNMYRFFINLSYLHWRSWNCNVLFKNNYCQTYLVKFLTVHEVFLTVRNLQLKLPFESK